jgi:hypothetical protein
MRWKINAQKVLVGDPKGKRSFVERMAWMRGCEDDIKIYTETTA